MAEAVVVVSMGASTAVGRDASSSAAAVRAGISGFAQHPSLLDSTGEPMRAAIAPWLDIGLSGADRFEALLFPALDQALEPMAADVDDTAGLAIALGLPSPRPGLPKDLERQMMSRINKRYGRFFGSAATFCAGHAAGLVAAQAALDKLSQGSLDACVVAGVDSYIEPSTLAWLESCDQLHGAGRLNNAWGFVPGEAGAALLLMRESVARKRELDPLAILLAVGTATEAKRIKTETVCIGEGLTLAFRGALAAIPAGMQVSDVYCDMNGEPYRADEFGFTALRTSEHFESATDFIAPADCWGDAGAASGPLHMMLSCIASGKGYAKGPISLVWSSSEFGQRAAASLAMAPLRS